MELLVITAILSFNAMLGLAASESADSGSVQHAFYYQSAERQQGEEHLPKAWRQKPRVAALSENDSAAALLRA